MELSEAPRLETMALDWGDGAIDVVGPVEAFGASTVRAPHTYEVAGCYKVELTARLDDGMELSTTQVMVVRDDSQAAPTGAAAAGAAARARDTELRVAAEAAPPPHRRPTGQPDVSAWQPGSQSPARTSMPPWMVGEPGFETKASLASLTILQTAGS